MTTPEKSVEEIVEEFRHMEVRYKRRQRNTCATCGEPNDHGTDSNYTHQYDEGMDTYNFPIDWLTQTLQAERQRCEEVEKRVRSEVENETRGNDAYQYLGNELHIFVRSIVQKVKITRNGEVWEFNIPEKNSSAVNPLTQPNKK